MVVGYHHFRKPPYGYFWVSMLDVWTWMLHDLIWSLDSQGYQFQGVKRKNVSLRFYTSGVDVEKGVNVFWKIHDSLQPSDPPKTPNIFFCCCVEFCWDSSNFILFHFKSIYLQQSPPKKQTTPTFILKAFMFLHATFPPAVEPNRWFPPGWSLHLTG